jgi:hypothetical protein
MSVANNQSFKAGPRCLYTMPLFISDNEKAEFTAADGTLLRTDKTAGEGHAPAASVATPAAARSAVMHFGGLQGRAGAAGDVTAFLNIEDGAAMAGYTTKGVDVSGRKHVVVVGRANLFEVRVSKAPVTGTRVQPRAGGGNETVVDFATSAAAINGELAADRCIRAYYLPWRSNAATTMRLGNAADYFVTSTLTGCTFAAYGARTAPTVTHANNGAQPDLNLSQDYMGKLLDQIVADEADATNQGLRANETRFTTRLQAARRPLPQLEVRQEVRHQSGEDSHGRGRVPRHGERRVGILHTAGSGRRLRPRWPHRVLRREAQAPHLHQTGAPHLARGRRARGRGPLVGDPR